MNLKEIREAFREDSGRYDLVTANGSDSGVDRFINAAQKWLDRQLDFGGADGLITKSLSTSAWSTEIENLRAAKDVWVENASGDVCPLKKHDAESLYGYVQNGQGVDEAMPRYWANGAFAPGMRTTSSLKLFLYPIPDTSYTLHIDGLFSSAELVSDTDTSFWSVLFPDILIKTVFMKTEAFQRNSTGEADLRRSIVDDLRGLDHDEVEKQIAKVDQIQSSWRDIVS